MQQAKTLEEIKEILAQVTYKNWTLRIIEKAPDVILIQWVFMAPDNYALNEKIKEVTQTKNKLVRAQKYEEAVEMRNEERKLYEQLEALPSEPQYCRKWYVSTFSTASEIIRTAYKAVIEAEKHEIDENFRVNGISLFDPHTDLIDMTLHIENAPKDVREDMPKADPDAVWKIKAANGDGSKPNYLDNEK